MAGEVEFDAAMRESLKKLEDDTNAYLTGGKALSTQEALDLTFRLVGADRCLRGQGFPKALVTAAACQSAVIRVTIKMAEDLSGGLGEAMKEILQ